MLRDNAPQQPNLIMGDTSKGEIMANPVYLLVLSIGPTEAYHQLSKEEQTNLWSKWEEIEKRAGSKLIVGCDSRWANEEYINWGAVEYPDMDKYLQKVAELEKINFWRYWSAKTILGLKSSTPPEG